MLESMTGFGRGEHSQAGYTAIAEIRSVNNRYLEISYRLPQNLQHLEVTFKEQIQKYLERGKVNVTIQLEASGDDVSGLELDSAKVTAYKNLLHELAEQSGLSTTITLDQLIGFKDIFKTKELGENDIAFFTEISAKALGKALEEIKHMRVREGEILQKDLAERIRLIKEGFEKVQKLADGRIPESRDKLKERIAQLIEKEDVDSERLELEIVILADKMDISEEIVRMNSHLDYFLENLNEDKSTGRKLNFLLQEMHREANTIGSKANNAGIAHEVVSIKELLENIREQVQNIV